MTTHINLPRVVASADSPDYVQHMVTDINDTINRLNAVIIKMIQDIEALQAYVAAHP